MKRDKAREEQNRWIATRVEVKTLLGLKERDFIHLEKWAGIKSTELKEGYTAGEFERIRRRVAELKRHVNL